jgi:hypothetical protein
LHIAYDQLAGRGRWVPRDGLGTFPIRFPVPEPPGDDGWHIESTGVGVDGQPIVDPASRERVLLMLFLATGDRGDVWLCHPFLVHAAQQHRGTRVKFRAQPPLAGTGPIDHMRASDRSPVEEAIHRAVAQPTSRMPR